MQVTVCPRSVAEFEYWAFRSFRGESFHKQHSVADRDVQTMLSLPLGTSEERRPKLDALLLVLLAGSLSLNVFLGWKLKSTNHAKLIPAQTLTEGVEITDFDAYNLSNELQTISCRTEKTVLYVFSPSCSWCERNLENIKTLASLRGDSYRFIGISLTSANLENYNGTSKLGFPVYRNLSKDTLQKLKLGSTPQTIVISPDGRVVKNWLGAYGEKLRSEIEEFFSVKLSGLSSKDSGSDSLERVCR